MSQDQWVIQHKAPSMDVVLWWKPESAGYTTNLNLAGRYSLEEAQRIIRGRPGVDVAFPLERALAAAELVVFVGYLADPMSACGAVSGEGHRHVPAGHVCRLERGHAEHHKSETGVQWPDGGGA